MHTKKLISAFIITGICMSTISIFAETCPNLDGKKFNLLTDYNQFRNSVASQYTMPDMSGEILHFPLTFGKTEYIDMQSKTQMSQTAPYSGDSVSCTVSYTGSTWEQLDAYVKIDHKVKSTSNDWDAMDDQTAECQNPGAENTCTFDRVN